MSWPGSIKHAHAACAISRFTCAKDPLIRYRHLWCVVQWPQEDHWAIKEAVKVVRWQAKPERK